MCRKLCLYPGGLTYFLKVTKQLSQYISQAEPQHKPKTGLRLTFNANRAFGNGFNKEINNLQYFMYTAMAATKGCRRTCQTT